MTLSSRVAVRVSVPLVAAPMTDVSTPDLVMAACAAGAIGAIPTHNAKSPGELRSWFDAFRSQERSGLTGPWVPNLVVHPSNPLRDEHLAEICAAGPAVTIASVGSAVQVIPHLHAAEIEVWCDVSSRRHAERAIAAGADGLVLLSAGAGGQTGALNPFAFTRAVRGFFGGTIVLAGGLADGHCLRAALDLGADLGYMGTRFIATVESGASEQYRAALVEATVDDVLTVAGPAGLPTNVLAGSPEISVETSRSSRPSMENIVLASHPDIWSAGHGVDGVKGVTGAADVIAEIVRELRTAVLV